MLCRMCDSPARKTSPFCSRECRLDMKRQLAWYVEPRKEARRTHDEEMGWKWLGHYVNLGGDGGGRTTTVDQVGNMWEDHGWQRMEHRTTV